MSPIFDPERVIPDDPLPAERRLVERMLAGDERAMEEFADAYFPPVYRFAMSRLRGDRELARDIVQTTVCKALAKLESYRGEAPLTSWLCACCRNEIAMHFRRHMRTPAVVELDEQVATRTSAPTPGKQPDGVLERRETARQVHAALDRLPPHYASALEWKYLERVSVREIAQRLGLGPKAAESLLTRARKAFRDDYERSTAGRGSGRVAPFRLGEASP